MRLLVVVEATTQMLSMIYQRQPPLQELVGNSWVQLVALDPQSGEFNIFEPESGWIPWCPDDREMARVNRSAEWFMGSSGPLRPALIKTPAEDTTDA